MKNGKTARMIEYIQRHGSARTADIAKALGEGTDTVGSCLAPKVARGLLVVCKVEVPGRAPQNEYRLGSGIPPVGQSREERRIAESDDDEIDDEIDVEEVSDADLPEVPKPAARPEVPIVALDSGGRLQIRIGSELMVLSDAETREVGRFLVATQAAWA